VRSEAKNSPPTKKVLAGRDEDWVIHDPGAAPTLEFLREVLEERTPVDDGRRGRGPDVVLALVVFALPFPRAADADAAVAAAGVDAARAARAAAAAATPTATPTATVGVLEQIARRCSLHEDHRRRSGAGCVCVRVVF